MFCEFYLSKQTGVIIAKNMKDCGEIGTYY